MDFDLFDGEIDMEQGAEESSPWNRTLAYQRAAGKKPTSTHNHQLSLRVQWEKLQSEWLFLSMDAKLLLRLPEDINLASGDHVTLETRARELALQWSIDDLAFKFGIQERVWGELDSTSLLNVMVANDFSSFSFTTPEDSRLGQPMLGLTLFHAQGDWELVVNPLPLVNYYPGKIEGLMESTLQMDRTAFVLNDQAPKALAQTELALRWKRSLQDSDISIIAASVLANDPILHLNGTNSVGQLLISTEYPRYGIFGISGNYSEGNRLWQLELSYNHGLSLQTNTPMKSNAYAAALGMEYNHDSYNLSFELIQQHLMSGDSLQGLKRDSTLLTARYAKKYLHETLTLVYFASHQLQYGDQVHSAALTYSFSDDWRGEINATLFEAGDPTSPGMVTESWDQLGMQVSRTF